ncbi:MAG: 30S ribosomal protein S8 [Candidatus Pacebacteria bacterium]|nr:30S ribosomal protein S8 [Candidatus Paceibacterota bacterium]
MSDPIADMLIRIKNAQAVKHKTVDIPYSKMKYQIANILLKEGFIEKIERKFRKAKKILRIYLKYKNGESAIQGTKRISKPGRRVYLPYKKIKPPKEGYGIGIISTSQGLMTAREARKRKLGGEVICEIW